MGSKPYLPLFTKLPESRASRWLLAKEFIDAWYRPLQPGDGYSELEVREAESELGFPFPAALREWYLVAGKRKEVWSTQDHLLTPTSIIELRKSKHPYHERFRPHLVFYGENQGCEHWAVRDSDFGIDDPPVYRITEDRGIVSPTLSAFAIQTLLREVAWSAPLRGWGEVPSEVFREIGERLHRCDVPERFWSASDPFRAYEGRDLVALTYNDSWVNLAALDQNVCDQLSKQLRDYLEFDTPS